MSSLHSHFAMFLMMIALHPFLAHGAKVVAGAKQKETLTSKKEVWRPTVERSLLATCFAGQASNQLLCLRAYLYLAVKSGRSLVIPTWAMLQYTKPFMWEHVIDWHHMAQCLQTVHGRTTVLTLEDYKRELELKRHKNGTEGKHSTETTNATQTLNAACYTFSGEFYEDELFKRLLERNGLAVISATKVDLKVGSKRLPSVVNETRNFQGPLVALGDLIRLYFKSWEYPNYAYTPEDDLFVASNGCANLWKPHPAVQMFSAGIMRSLVGKNYGANHLRREGPWEYFAKNHLGQRRVRECNINEAALGSSSTAVRARYREHWVNLVLRG